MQICGSTLYISQNNCFYTAVSVHSHACLRFCEVCNVRVLQFICKRHSCGSSYLLYTHIPEKWSECFAVGRHNWLLSCLFGTFPSFFFTYQHHSIHSFIVDIMNLYSDYQAFQIIKVQIIGFGLCKSQNLDVICSLQKENSVALNHQVYMHIHWNCCTNCLILNFLTALAGDDMLTGSS